MWCPESLRYLSHSLAAPSRGLPFVPVLCPCPSRGIERRNLNSYVHLSCVSETYDGLIVKKKVVFLEFPRSFWRLIMALQLGKLGYSGVIGDLL